jgi:hypothetical protein
MSPSTTVVAAAGLTGSTPMGPAIYVSIDNGGGRCQTYRQHPLGALPSTSPSTTVVATARLTYSTTRGASIDISNNNGGGRCRPYRWHPPGARH